MSPITLMCLSCSHTQTEASASVYHLCSCGDVIRQIISTYCTSHCPAGYLWASYFLLQKTYCGTVVTLNKAFVYCKFFCHHSLSCPLFPSVCFQFGPLLPNHLMTTQSDSRFHSLQRWRYAVVCSTLTLSSRSCGWFCSFLNMWRLKCHRKPIFHQKQIIVLNTWSGELCNMLSSL